MYFDNSKEDYGTTVDEDAEFIKIYKEFDKQSFMNDFKNEFSMDENFMNSLSKIIGTDKL